MVLYIFLDMTSKKCPFDQSEMKNIGVGNSVFEWGDNMNFWVCKDCGFVALFKHE